MSGLYCSHIIKRCLLLGRKNYEKPRQCIKMQRYHFAYKCLDVVKAMDFTVVMYRCESWTIKKSWALKNWYFKTVVLEETLESPLHSRRSNQSFLKKINPEYSLEGLMMRLKLQYFDHLMGKPIHWRRSWCWERLNADREGLDWGWDGWMTSPTQWTWVWVNSGRWWRTKEPGTLQPTGSQRVGHHNQQEILAQCSVNFVCLLSPDIHCLWNP